MFVHQFTPQALAVRADPEMLRAALLNVLLNACQSGSEEVEVSAGVVGDACHITSPTEAPASRRT